MHQGGRSAESGRGLVGYLGMASAVALFGWICWEGARSLVEESARARLAQEMQAALDADDEAARACKLLLVDSAHARALETLSLRTTAPGTERRLEPLAPLLLASAPPPYALGLLRARLQFGRGEYAGAARSLEAWAEGAPLGPADVRRLLQSLVHSGQAARAVAFARGLGDGAREVRLELCEVLARTHDPHLRSFATELAAETVRGGAEAAERDAARLAAILEPVDPEALTSLLATTWEPVRSRSLDAARARLAPALLARAAAALADAERAGRRTTRREVEAALPHGDPWGRPVALDTRGTSRFLVCLGADGAPGGAGLDADLEVEIRTAP